MTVPWKVLVVAITVAALVGCAADPAKRVVRNKGQQELSTGIRRYEDGKYIEAARALESALAAGLDSVSQVKAHKYLAFIHCTSGRERQCRDEFRKALDIDPAMELEPAESGHPTWDPVFRSVKAHR